MWERVLHCSILNAVPDASGGVICTKCIAPSRDNSWSRGLLQPPEGGAAQCLPRVAGFRFEQLRCLTSSIFALYLKRQIVKHICNILFGIDISWKAAKPHGYVRRFLFCFSSLGTWRFTLQRAAKWLSFERQYNYVIGVILLAEVSFARFVSWTAVQIWVLYGQSPDYEVASDTAMASLFLKSRYKRTFIALQ